MLVQAGALVGVPEEGVISTPHLSCPAPPQLTKPPRSSQDPYSWPEGQLPILKNLSAPQPPLPTAGCRAQGAGWTRFPSSPSLPQDKTSHPRGRASLASGSHSLPALVPASNPAMASPPPIRASSFVLILLALLAPGAAGLGHFWRGDGEGLGPG